MTDYNDKPSWGEQLNTSSTAPTTDSSRESTPLQSGSSTEKTSYSDLFVFWSRRELSVLIPAIIAAAFVAGSKAAYALILGKIFDVVAKIPTRDITGEDILGQISKLCLILTGLGGAKALSSSVFMALWIVFGEGRARSARRSLFQSLLGRDMAWFDGRKDGISSLITGLQTHIRELQLATSQLLGQIISDAFVCIACLVIAFYHSWELTLVLFATVPPSVFLLGFLGRPVDVATASQRAELGLASQHVSASLLAIDLVKVYNGYDDELWQYLGRVRKATRHYLIQARCACSQMGFVKFWMVGLFVVGFWFGVYLVDQGRSTAGNILTTFYAVLISFQAVEELGNQWLTVVKGMAAGQVMGHVVAEAAGHHDGGKGRTFRPRTVPECIELHNVSFAYPTNPTKLALQPSNFMFSTREISFIVGKSGSGKSTVADLLVKFYKPTTGTILIDSIPSHAIDAEWLRQNVTLIQQASNLFSGTFAMNVSIGAADPKKVTPSAVKLACQTALLQSTLSNLPEGLDTVIGPNGHALSGGQMQRLALARAKLRDPAVLILDEVTSGLDPLTADMIMEAIRTWRRGKTTIIITHDVSQIENQDYVYVMDKGHIMQEGYFEKLSSEQGSMLHTMLHSEDIDDGTSTRGSTTLAGSTPRKLKTFVDIAVSEPPSKRSSIMMGGMFLPTMNRQTNSHFGQQTSILSSNFNTTNTLDHGTSRAAPYETAESLSDIISEKRSSVEIMSDRGQYARVQRPRRVSRGVSTSSTGQSQDSHAGDVERVGDGSDKEPASLWSILRTILPVLDHSSRAMFFFGVLACFTVAAANPAFSYLFAQMLQAFWVPTGKEAAGRTWACALLGVACVDGLSVFTAFYLMERSGQAWVDALRTEAFKRILRQPKSWFDDPGHAAARIAECLDRNGEEMRRIVATFLPIITIATGMVLASVAWAMAISWNLTLVALAAGPVVIGCTHLAASVSDRCESISQRAAEQTSAVFADVFPNIRVVRALTLESYFAAEHDAAATRAFKSGVSRSWQTGILYGLNQAMADWLTALVFYHGVGLLVADGSTTTVASIMQVINLLLFSIGTATAMLADVPQISACKAVATQLLHYATLDFHPDENHGSDKASARPRGIFPIRMRGLQFRYPSRPSTMVLRNLNLTISAGELIAVVGPSGGGKSTLASMLLRLYDPLPAEDNTSPLTYAHTPHTSLSTPLLRQRMAYVPQHPFLFPRSIAANITYGLHDASPLHNPAHIERAARLAGIHDFITSLPEGYATIVGDGGMKLSGGQAQRVCLARGLLRGEGLVVLDEPTSKLDGEARETVRRAIRGMVDWGMRNGGEISAVVVTHEREMMRVADRVVWVEGGVVVAEGRYEELVRSRRFAELVGERGAW